MASGGASIEGVKVGSSKTGEKFSFFFGRDCVFSQWYGVEFKVDGVDYNCAEQYMMHQKAGEFLLSPCHIIQRLHYFSIATAALLGGSGP